MTISSNGQLADVVEGLVESTNERGIRVQGEWRNISKFHPVDLPERGGPRARHPRYQGLHPFA